jgi:hypothetical protein
MMLKTGRNMHLILVKILSVGLIAAATPPACTIPKNIIGSCLMGASSSGDNVMSDERHENYLSAARERDADARAIAACEPHEKRLPKTDVLVAEATTLDWAAVDAHFGGKPTYAMRLLLRAKNVIDLMMRATKGSSTPGAFVYSSVSAHLAGHWPSQSIMDLIRRMPAPPDEIWKCVISS